MTKPYSKHLIVLLAGLTITATTMADEAEHKHHGMKGESSETVSRQGQDFSSGGNAESQGKLMVSDGWVRATIGMSKVSAAYLTVKNHGGEIDALVAMSSPVAGKVELHTHVMDGDMMKMRQVKEIEVNPGETAVFRPGGNHIMLTDLKQPLKAGERIPLKLVFKKAGSIHTHVMVKGLDNIPRQVTSGKHQGHEPMEHEKEQQVEHKMEHEEEHRH